MAFHDYLRISYDLRRMNCCHDRRRGADEPEFAKHPLFEISESGALAVRPPDRVTATQPTTQKSSLGMSSNPIGSPCSMNPRAVAAVSKSTPFAASLSGSIRRYGKP